MASRQLIQGNRAITWTSIWVLAVCLLAPATASAAQFTSRKLTLGSSATSTATTHKFDFTVPAAAGGSVGSIQFLYCVNASGTCVTPTGLSTTSATITAQTGATGFTMVNTTQGSPYLTRGAAAIAANTALSYTLGAVTNPSATNTSFYVRISYFTSTNTTGTAIDTGIVAASTAAQIVVTAHVDEILIFCVYTGANCAAGGTTVVLGTITPTTTGVGISYMDAGTNAGTGFAIQYTAPTLTSGGNTITAIGGTATASTVGAAQFGINAYGPNTTPLVTGSQIPTGTAPIGSAATNYNTADVYAFVASTLTTIASSSAAANTTKYSVSYLANVNSSQAAGDYTSTFTYICTATF